MLQKTILRYAFPFTLKSYLYRTCVVDYPNQSSNTSEILMSEIRSSSPTCKKSRKSHPDNSHKKRALKIQCHSINDYFVNMSNVSMKLHFLMKRMLSAATIQWFIAINWSTKDKTCHLQFDLRCHLKSTSHVLICVTRLSNFR